MLKTQNPRLRRIGFLLLFFEEYTFFGYSIKKNPQHRCGFCAFSDRDRIRTCDRLLRRQMLYPAELRDHSAKK